MLPYIDVLSRLDHIRFCSGQDLANSLGVTRATIHNCILRIDAMGIAVQRVRGKGYKLANKLDLLDAQSILAKLSQATSKRLQKLNIEQQTSSTNISIAENALPKAGHFSVLLAEMQTAGKGRRGRAWVSPYAANIYMSVLCNMQKPLSELSTVSPSLAICIAQALTDIGVQGIGLKWPNDIYCENKKLAGLLIECSGELSGYTKMIIGIGVNVYMSQHNNISIEQRWTDIISHLDVNRNKDLFSRNELVASLLNHMQPLLDEINHSDSSGLSEQWAQWDIMGNKRVVLHAATESISGIARGIDDYGCLLLETDAGLQQISAGDVSLRAES